MSIPKRIHDLLFKAGHPGTPKLEADICARKASKLYYEHSLKKESTPTFETDSNVDNMWHDVVMDPDTSQWQNVELFQSIIAKAVGICKSCGKPFNKGEIVASVFNKGITHHKCRRFWTDQK